MSFRQELIDLRNKYKADLEIKEKELEKKERDRKAAVVTRILSETVALCKKAASEGLSEIKVMDLIKGEDYNYCLEKKPVINAGSIVDLVVIGVKELRLDCKIKYFFDREGDCQFALFVGWES